MLNPAKCEDERTDHQLGFSPDQAIEFPLEDSCASLRLELSLLLGSHEVLIGSLRVSVSMLGILCVKLATPQPSTPQPSRSRRHNFRAAPGVRIRHLVQVNMIFRFCSHHGGRANRSPGNELIAFEPESTGSNKSVEDNFNRRHHHTLRLCDTLSPSATGFSTKRHRP